MNLNLNKWQVITGLAILTLRVFNIIDTKIVFLSLACLLIFILLRIKREDPLSTPWKNSVGDSLAYNISWILTILLAIDFAVIFFFQEWQWSWIFLLILTFPLMGVATLSYVISAFRAFRQGHKRLGVTFILLLLVPAFIFFTITFALSSFQR